MNPGGQSVLRQSIFVLSAAFMQMSMLLSDYPFLYYYYTCLPVDVDMQPLSVPFLIQKQPFIYSSKKKFFLIHIKSQWWEKPLTLSFMQLFHLILTTNAKLGLQKVSVNRFHALIKNSLLIYSSNNEVFLYSYKRS